MRLRALRQGDVQVPGHLTMMALFPDQVYDLPAEVASDWLVAVDRKPPEQDEHEEDERPRRRARKD